MVSIHDEVIDALAEQVECYARLAKLAQLQHEHVQHSQVEDLLEVLHKRQVVLERVQELEKVIAPAKKQWGQYVQGLLESERETAQSLMTQTRLLLEEITTADRNDALVLQQRKLSLGKQINQATAARQVNRTYAAAAYGKPSSRVDFGG